MFYCGVILLLAASLVQGFAPHPHPLGLPHPQPSGLPDPHGWSADALNTLPAETTTPSPLQDETVIVEIDGDEVAGVCLFGDLPSVSCVAKCFFDDKSAYCDEEASCRCGSEPEEEAEEDPGRSFTLFTTLQPDHDTDAEEGAGAVGVCFFGRIPSPACMFRCSVRGEGADCEEDGSCVCRERTLGDLLTTKTTPEITRGHSSVGKDLAGNDAESDTQSITFFIFDLFEPEEEPEEVSGSDCNPRELWTVPHLVAMFVLFLVAVLVVLELSLCYKRRCSGHRCAQRVLAPELEQGVVKQ